MKIIRFKDNILRIKVDSIEDLYLLERIINKGDKVKAKTLRKYKSQENDKGELKEVILKIEVEKVELDKNNAILRINGQIIAGKPEQFITLHAYHTINVKQKSIIEIEKSEWKRYILDKIIEQSKKAKEPKIGIVVLDDETATIGEVSDIGIVIKSEIESKLSKRMSQKLFDEAKNRYFESIKKVIENISTNIIAIGGPGFMKDELYKFLKESDIKKDFILAYASDVGRSGIKEVLNNESVKRFFAKSLLQKEFNSLDELFKELVIGKGITKKDEIKERIYEVKKILVNDSVLNNEEIKPILDMADKLGIPIEIFNSNDDAGKQLKGLGDIVALT